MEAVATINAILFSDGSEGRIDKPFVTYTSTFCRL